MSTNPGPYCITGVKNEERIATLTAQISALTLAVESLRQCVAAIQLREARYVGFAAGGGAVLGTISAQLVGMITGIGGG